MTLDHVALFTHWIPGTQRGYHVVVDQASGLATIFEVWFSGFTDNREVQREIHFGYVAEPGKAAPEARHSLTNRAEGKGFYWKQDSGVETLELFPSTFYSNFVELSRLGGELGFCAPSDYVKIDDDLYVYSRVECEFSGVQTLYVFDANRAEQIGVRLGFDGSDALEYHAFTGKRRMARPARAVRALRRHGRDADAGAGQRRAARERRAPRLPADAKQLDDVEGRSRGADREERVRPAEPDGRQQEPRQRLPRRQRADAAFDNGVAVEYRSTRSRACVGAGAARPRGTRNATRRGRARPAS